MNNSNDFLETQRDFRAKTGGGRAENARGGMQISSTIYAKIHFFLFQCLPPQNICFLNSRLADNPSQNPLSPY